MFEYSTGIYGPFMLKRHDRLIKNQTKNTLKFNPLLKRKENAKTKLFHGLFSRVLRVSEDPLNEKKNSREWYA